MTVLHAPVNVPKSISVVYAGVVNAGVQPGTDAGFPLENHAPKLRDAVSEEPEVPEQTEAQHLDRPVVPELDEILGHPFKVLDDGFVRVVDYMGSDHSIVQAARVSYGAVPARCTRTGG